MTHYEERLENDLAAIRTRVAAVATAVATALKNSVHAALTGDHQLASQVILGDLPINREVRAIDRLCHAFVARHLPSAGHLRFVSAVLRLDVELERIGDYAVAIAREAVQLSTLPSGPVRQDIQLIAEQAERMFEQAMKSFNESNAELARGTKGMAGQVESTYQKVFADLLQEGEGERRPIKDLFALLVIFNRLARVSDQSKNICEDTLFAVKGETKGEKVYRILFLDERNDSLSQLAEAYARKAFPESGEYTSAGWAPAERLLPALEVFMDANGLDGGRLRPKALDYTAEELAGFHVVIGLDQGGRAHIPQIPFHTVFLDWSLGPPPQGLDAERLRAFLEEAYRTLTVRIRGLIETLRGEEAG